MKDNKEWTEVNFPLTDGTLSPSNKENAESILVNAIVTQAGEVQPLPIPTKLFSIFDGIDTRTVEILALIELSTEVTKDALNTITTQYYLAITSTRKLKDDEGKYGTSNMFSFKYNPYTDSTSDINTILNYEDDFIRQPALQSNLGYGKKLQYFIARQGSKQILFFIDDNGQIWVSMVDTSQPMVDMVKAPQLLTYNLCFVQFTADTSPEGKYRYEPNPTTFTYADLVEKEITLPGRTINVWDLFPENYSNIDYKCKYTCAAFIDGVGIFYESIQSVLVFTVQNPNLTGDSVTPMNIIGWETPPVVVDHRPIGKDAVKASSRYEVTAKGKPRIETVSGGNIIRMEVSGSKLYLFDQNNNVNVYIITVENNGTSIQDLSCPIVKVTLDKISTISQTIYNGSSAVSYNGITYFIDSALKMRFMNREGKYDELNGIITKLPSEKDSYFANNKIFKSEINDVNNIINTAETISLNYAMRIVALLGQYFISFNNMLWNVKTNTLSYYIPDFIIKTSYQNENMVTYHFENPAIITAASDDGKLVAMCNTIFSFAKSDYSNQLDTETTPNIFHKMMLVGKRQLIQKVGYAWIGRTDITYADNFYSTNAQPQDFYLGLLEDVVYDFKDIFEEVPLRYLCRHTLNEVGFARENSFFSPSGNGAKVLYFVLIAGQTSVSPSLNKFTICSIKFLIKSPALEKDNAS